MRGIDVSGAQGLIDWQAVRADGVEFAMIKASQGKLLRNPRSGAFTDPYFVRNIEGAAAAGIPVGVYHYLCAGHLLAAHEEAMYFLSVIEPFRDKIPLWAVCDAEEDRFLPKDNRTLTSVVRLFLARLRAAGFRPMLYSNPNYLRYRLGDMSKYDLWLAYWGTTEARALAYNPKIWQYGTGRAGNLSCVDCNRGYFSLHEKGGTGC